MSFASAAGLPAQPFFGRPDQRVALARERFFDGGERPTGLVSEAVIQSWTRCAAARRSPQWAVAFDPVSRGHLRTVLERSRALLLAADDDIAHLEQALLGTASRVLLTDAAGMVVHATHAGADTPTPVLDLAARLGVNLTEGHVGTNAPALVLKSGEPVTVLGAEHYHESVHPLSCAAAPIRDSRGALAGVLDITVESRPFMFDAAALVGVYATLIENRLLSNSARGQLVLRFQLGSGMLGSPLEALAGIDGRGRVVWHNGTAQRLLGLARTPAQPLPAVESLFGAGIDALLARCGGEHGAPLRLPNGLTVWLQARPPPAASTPAAHAPADTAEDAGGDTVATQPTATLDEATGDAIERALADCDGNISRAARLLKVSRGLVYRHLQRG